VCFASNAPRRDSRSNDRPRSDASVPTHARMFVAAKTPVLALTVTHRKFVVSKVRMSDVLNPWSSISSVPVTRLSTW
jgi:hypothetical protein